MLRVEHPSDRVALVLDLMGAEDDGVMIILPDDPIQVRLGLLPSAGRRFGVDARRGLSATRLRTFWS